MSSFLEQRHPRLGTARFSVPELVRAADSRPDNNINNARTKSPLHFPQPFSPASPAWFTTEYTSA